MSDTNELSDMQKQFVEHQTEIRRRSDVADSSQVNSSTFERAENDGTDDPFVNDEQQYIVFSLSQQEFSPKPVDCNQPGVCIFGAFPNEADAAHHAKLVQREHPDISIMINRTHTWLLAVNTIAHFQNGSYVREKTERMLKNVSETIAKNEAEFEANVKEQRSGKTNKPVEEKTAPSIVEDVTNARSHKISNSCRVMDQKLCVASFVKDEEEDCEFLFKVYAFYDDADSANKYVRNVCGDHVKEFNIDVVSACAWIFPQQMTGDKAKKEVYRSDELNKIMSTHKKAPQDVSRFYNENNMDPSTQITEKTNVEISDTVRKEETKEDGVCV